MDIAYAIHKRQISNDPSGCFAKHGEHLIISITLTFAKSIGWIAMLAIVAAVPPHTNGSAIFAALFSGILNSIICYNK